MTTFNFGDLMKTAALATERLPEGDYQFIVKEAKEGKSQKGADMIKCTFTITAGQYTGRNVNNNFTISPDKGVALGIFFRHMESFGMTANYFSTNPSLGQICGELTNRRGVMVVGKPREWNGREFDNVVDIKPVPTGVAAGPLAPGAGPAGPPMPSPMPAPTPMPAPAPMPAPVPSPALALSPVTERAPMPSTGVTEALVSAPPAEPVKTDNPAPTTQGAPPALPF